MFLLQLRNELWKLFGKKRTYIGFGMFLLAQNLIITIYYFHHKDMVRLLENNGFDAARYISALTVSTIMFAMMALTLLPLYVALVGGDLVAKEAEDGSLRMILSRPVSRFRLLLVKWLAGVFFSFLLVMILGLAGWGFASMWYPQSDLFTPPGVGLHFNVFEFREGLKCYLLAQLLMVPKACTVMTIGFMFSCFNMKPAAATILALSVIFISRILQELPFLHDFQTYFPTYYMDVWAEAMEPRIAWWKIGECLSALAGFNLTFLVIGFTGFQMRDIKS